MFETVLLIHTINPPKTNLHLIAQNDLFLLP